MQQTQTAGPTIGLVVPGQADRVPPEGLRLYPQARFLAHRTGVRSLTPQGYDAAIEKIVPASVRLAEQGAQAIMVIGTSLTFCRGPRFNEDLQGEIRHRTGLPASTMSTAVVDALQALGAVNLAVATAYAADINDRLAELLRHHGFEVGSLVGLGIEQFGEAVTRTSQAEITALVAKACAAATGADAILIACGGLRTLDLAAPLERHFGLPVVSSMPAALWAAMRLAGARETVQGYGALLARERVAAPGARIAGSVVD